MSGNNLAVLQNSGSLLRPDFFRKRPRYIIWNGPAFGEFQHGVFNRVVSDPGENSGLYLGPAEHEQPGGRACAH